MANTNIINSQVGVIGDNVKVEGGIHFHAPAPTIPLQYPPKVDHFTDREKELTKLLGDLQPGKVVTLCGPGGIGKSALASKAIWELAPNNTPSEKFPDGILRHDFYKEPKSIKALKDIAIAFGEDPKQSPVGAAKKALSGKNVLVLLDGAEDADDLPLVLNILGACSVLITTRKKDDAGAHRDDIQSLPIDEAIKLLQAWGKTNDIESERRICELTGCLPLAVRLAGRYIFNGNSVKEYLSDLEKTPLDALDQGDRKLESVPVLLKRSLNQVRENAVIILGIAGILAFASFSRNVIQAAIPDVNIKKSIHKLIGYGLLNRDGERFVISHALIHTYARKNHKPDNIIVERIAGYYNSFAREHKEQGLEGYAVLNIERVHIMRILEECKKREIWQMCNNLVWTIAAHQGYLDTCGYWTDRIITLKLGIDAAQKLENREVEGDYLGHLGLTYNNLSQIEKAMEYYEYALVIRREIGDRRGESIDLSNIGIAYNNLGQFEKAIEYYEQALVIDKEISHREGEGIRLCNLGEAYSKLGQIEKAIDYCEQALAISKEIGNRHHEANRLGNLAEAYSRFGQIEKAIEYYEQSLIISKEIGFRLAEAYHLGGLGDAYNALGLIENAIEYYEQALVISKKIGYKQGEGNQLCNMGIAYFNQNQKDKARKYLEESIAIYEAIKSPTTDKNAKVWLKKLDE